MLLKTTSLKRNQWLVGIALLLSVALGAAYEYMAKNSTSETAAIGIQLQGGTLLKKPQSLPAFSLKDTRGQYFSNANLQRGWHLAFFGYAHCPDVCPATVNFVSQVWDKLPSKIRQGEKLNFLFFSLDPDRDSPEYLKEFLGRYRNDFIGLTGNRKQLDEIFKGLGIYRSAEERADGLIDHSGTLLLINAQGRLQAIFSPPFDLEGLVKDLSLIVN
ncbi:MAG: SCO family protein [Gammaproteobacteria bacterium]